MRKPSSSVSSIASPRSRPICGIWSALFRGSGALDEPVEQRCALGLAVVSCVGALAGEDGQEFGAGAEVGAGLAGALHPAVEFGRAGAQVVAEHAGVGFASEPGHAGGLVVGRQLRWLAVERVDLGADGVVFVGDDAGGDSGGVRYQNCRNAPAPDERWGWRERVIRRCWLRRTGALSASLRLAPEVS